MILKFQKLPKQQIFCVCFYGNYCQIPDEEVI